MRRRQRHEAVVLECRLLQSEAVKQPFLSAWTFWPFLSSFVIVCLPEGTTFRPQGGDRLSIVEGFMPELCSSSG